MDDLWRLFRQAAGNGAAVNPDPPGTSWTARTSPTLSMYDVAWSPKLKLYVGVGAAGNQVVTSSDGITWTQRMIPWSTTTDAAQFNRIIWNPVREEFFTVGGGGGITTRTNYFMKSTDGINWTRVPTFSGVAQQWTDVCWSTTLNMYVATRTGVFGDATAYIGTSATGDSWNFYQMPGHTTSSSAFNVASIVDSGTSLKIFIAIGGVGVVVTSTDGVTWTRANNNLTSYIVVWSTVLSRYVGLLPSGSIRMSVDGYTWITTATIPSASSTSARAYIEREGTMYVLQRMTTPANRHIMFASTDAVTWVVQGDPTPIMNPTTGVWQALAHDPLANNLVTVGTTSPYVATSP